MRILRNILLAAPCFWLAAVVIGQHIQFVQFASEARANGQFVCGTFAPNPLLAVLPIAAGIAALFGRYLLAAFIGIPTAAWVMFSSFYS